MGQRQGVGIGNGLLEHGLSADRNDLVVDFEARENDWGHEGIFANVFREERGDPSVAAEEHLAGAPSLVTTPREVIAPQAVGDVVVLELLRLRIEAGDTPLAADPQSAAGILENTHEIVARQTICFRVARHDFILRIESIETHSRGQPEFPGPVFVNGSDAASLKLLRVTQAGRVVHEPLGFIVEAAQDAAPRPEPQGTETIAMNRRDAEWKVFRRAWTKPVVGESLRHWIKVAHAAKLSHP